MKKQIVGTTFTPMYNPIEDRICLVINYEDPYTRVDFMITRSFMLNLIPSAEEYFEQYYPRENKMQITPVETPSFETPTDNVNLELLQSTQELLLEVNFSLDENRQNIVLRLSSQNTQAVATLPPLIFESLIKSLKRSIPSLEWGIGFDF